MLLLPQVFSQGSLTVTVSTNQTQYTPGDTVTIFGKVVDNQSNPIVGAAVSIEVNEPPIYVQLVSSDQSGSYSDQFVLSDVFPQGQYTIYVTAHKGNFTAAQQTQFTVLSQTTSTTASSSSTSQTTPSKPMLHRNRNIRLRTLTRSFTPPQSQRQEDRHNLCRKKFHVSLQLILL